MSYKFIDIQAEKYDHKIFIHLGYGVTVYDPSWNS